MLQRGPLQPCCPGEGCGLLQAHLPLVALNVPRP